MDHIATRRCALYCSSIWGCSSNQVLHCQVDASLGDHHKPHGSVDPDAHATADWSKSAKIPAFPQQTCGIGQSSVDSGHGATLRSRQATCWWWWRSFKVVDRNRVCNACNFLL